MKKTDILVAALAATALLSSCQPEVFSMFVDMRSTPKSGIDLAGKTVSVVYMDDLSGKDTVFNANLAKGFAQALEKEWFDGAEAIAIYRKEKDMAGNYASRDTLVKVAVESGDDLVFMFDSPEYKDLAVESRHHLAANGDSLDVVHAKLPFRLNLYAYDTMNSADTVRVFTGSSSVVQDVICTRSDTEEDVLWKLQGQLQSAGENTGTKSAAKFLPTWKTREFDFYTTSGYAWNQAALAVLQHKWKDAIDQWMALLDTGSYVRKAALEYNIANAFYILGDNKVALQWCELSEKHADMPLTKKLMSKLR